MGKDKSLQKIVQPKSLEKIIEYNVLVKRGLRALGIETPEDKFEKELYKLINEFSNLIFFKKLRNEQFIKFGKADARTYLNKLNKLADKIIAVCQKTLKNIGSNSPLKFPTSFMMGFLLMSKNRNQDATVFFSECLKQHDQMFYLLLWSGKTELVESPEPEEKRLLDIILREKKIIPTSKEFRKLSNRLWNKFGKRDYACISTLAGDCYLKLKDRGNALVYYQKTINFLAAIYQESQPRMRIWRESRGYLQEMYDEIIDFLYEW